MLPKLLIEKISTINSHMSPSGCHNNITKQLTNFNNTIVRSGIFNIYIYTYKAENIYMY